MSDRPTPELMAPAGDWEALRAAVANGADAVYFGLSNYSARQRATNFTLEELPAVVRYLRDHNVRGYLTFNTLIFSDELEQAAAWLAEMARAGVDALIVQDLGLARLIARMAPGLEVHGSTQMTLTDPQGIKFAADLGIRRVVLPRELSIADIARLAPLSRAALEVFVHGALCISYSGQCLTSESIGGRSANRGQCAQACRLPYDLIVDGQQRGLREKAYLLSPQDLAAYDLIEPLVKMGVRCFKIEGRLKSAHYVAATTQAYRTAIDAALDGREFDITPQQKLDLAQSFSRGFTHGFLDGVNHQTLVPALFPKSRGVYVGEVVEKTGRGVVVKLAAGEAQIKPGDGVVFDEGHPEQDEQGGRVYEVAPRGRAKGAILVEVVLGRGDVNLAAIAVGARVWKTDDPAIRRRLERSFARDEVARPVPLHFRVRAAVGQQLQVKAWDSAGHSATAVWDKPLEKANKHPLTLDVAREQLGRLGDTPYQLGEVELIGENEAGDVQAMVPKSVLNDLRRQVVQQLAEERRSSSVAVDANALEDLRAEAAAFLPEPPPTVFSLSVMARTMDQLQATLAYEGEDGLRPSMVYCDFEDVRRYREAVAAARSAGMPIALATLRILKPGEDGLLRQILDCQPDAILVRNLGAMCFYREVAPEVPLLGDYSLNVANELTAVLLLRSGMRRLVPSYDLNWQQLTAMLGRIAPGWFETVIHQHMPMFHMEHCVFAATLSSGKDHRDCGRPCDRHRLELRDRVGARHPVVPDVGCRNTVFNATAQSAAQYVPEMKRLGIWHYRVELLCESASEVAPLLRSYARVLLALDDPESARRQIRAMNQLGVTAGTLGFS